MPPSKFFFTVYLLVISALAVLFSYTIPGIGIGVVVAEILALWVMVVLTVKAYLREVKS